MKKKQSGFTVLEVMICIIIFAVLLDGLWGVFGNIHFEFMVFSKQVELDNEIDGIESFVKTYIRESDEVSVVVKDSSGAEIIIEAGTDMGVEYEGLEFKEIRFGKQISDGTTEYSRIKYVSSDRKLNYISDGTTSLIADEVNNIKVTRKKGSNVIEFSCELSKQGTDAADGRKKVNNNFSESIIYKQGSTNSGW